MDANTKEVLIAFSTGVTTVGLAYVAARWHVSRNPKVNSGNTTNGNNNTVGSNPDTLNNLEVK
jgi:hypothetical protein